MLQVPFAFKYAIDALTVDPTGMTAANMPLVTLMPATLLLGYGAARAGSALFNELRNAVFAKASLHADHDIVALACLRLCSSILCRVYLQEMHVPRSQCMKPEH